MRLLLAVDIHEESKGLLALAVQWARRLGAVIDLVYVDDVYLVQDPEIRALLDKEWPKVWAVHEKKLKELQQQLPSEVRGEALFRTGQAPVEITEAAKDRDAVLIGTHGRRGLSHAFLGSVAERVVRLSSVPVLVLRQIAT